MEKKKVFFFDVETTGLDAWRNDIVQIAGCIEIDGEVKETFNWHCQPYNPGSIEQSALDVTGLTKEEIMEFDTPMSVYLKLTATMGRYVDKFDKKDKFYPAGYNVDFDMNFLRAFFKKSGDKYFGSWFNGINLDPFHFFRLAKFSGQIDTENLKLETMAKLFNIEIKAHDALSDIEATRSLLKVALTVADTSLSCSQIADALSSEPKNPWAGYLALMVSRGYSEHQVYKSIRLMKEKEEGEKDG